MAAGTSQRERLAALVEPVVSAAGYDLEEITVTAAGRRRVVRVVVDADTGISLDEVAEVSKAISVLLDQREGPDGVLGAAPYVLEVSSPGIDRPLRTERHWRRAAGRLVEVPVRDAGPVTGRVRRATATGVVLDVAGAEREFGYEALGPGRVQVEFSREGGDA
jgi:ribosome maturation factor RimP